MNKRIGIIICVVLIVIAVGVVFIACDKTKAAPTYTGMSISRYSIEQLQSVANAASEWEIESDENAITADMKDIVQVEVITDNVMRYYVLPGETFVVQVHLSNPGQFEIQSFTLNGIKYANYMFKEGSTMDMLLLEVTAPTVSGYMDLTIDAIKYIDGTDIKDVRMNGDKTIKAGVAYQNDPKVEISNEVIGTTNFSVDVNMIDADHIVRMTTARIFLTDGKNHVSKQLIRGINHIEFNNLIMSTNYKYGIVVNYDKIDGIGDRANWLFEKSFSTLKSIYISNLDIEQESVNFSVAQTDSVGEIKSIKLLELDNTEVQTLTDLSQRTFANLLSNHEYKIEIIFDYTISNIINTESTIVRFRTLAKTIPTIDVKIENITETSATGIGTLTDTDEVCTINTIELYKNDVKIAEYVDLSTLNFRGLSFYTKYVVKVGYSYNLNDGKGVQIDVAEFTFTTNPHFEFTSCEVMNTSVVQEGDTIYIQAFIDNPAGATYSKVTINGKEYAASKISSATYLYVEILFENQFEGGETVLEIGQIVVTLDGAEYTIFPNENNKATVFINGQFTVEKAEIVNADDKIVTEATIGDTYFIKLTVNNSTGYEIYSIESSCSSENGYADVYEFGIEDLTIIDNRIIYIPYIIHGLCENYIDSAINSVSIKITYRNKYKEGKTYISTENRVWGYNKKVVYISTPQDLLKMSGNEYYVLTNDINLKDYEWHGGEFCGVFDGNGYTIHNMRVVNTFDTSQTLGLFSYASGIIRNLNIDNVTMLVTVSNGNRASYGAIAAGASNLIVDNCTVTNATVSIKGNACVGGLIGVLADDGYYATAPACYLEYCQLINCTHNGNVSLTTGYMGGLIGEIYEDVNIVIENCMQNGEKIEQVN